jgi:hypothetical protein
MSKQSGKSTGSQASDMGRKGGLVGGRARATKLSAQQRSSIAKKGAEAKNKKAKQ